MEEKESSEYKVPGNTTSWVFGSDIKSLKSILNILLK